jgi:hypothetical protein
MTLGRNRRKSPTASANIPVLGRLRLESWFGQYCVGQSAFFSDRVLKPFVRDSETVDQSLRVDVHCRPRGLGPFVVV